MSSWPVARLGDELTFLTSGSRGWARYYKDNGAIFLRIQNVCNGRLVLDDIAFVQPPQTAEAKRTRVMPGDVLLSITADLGRTAVIPNDIGDAYINQHLAILRPRRLDPRFLSAYLTSPLGQTQIARLNRQGVKAGLNFEDIRSLPIPIPPLPDQRRIAEVLDRADALRAKRRTALAQLDKLTQSIFLDMFGDPVGNPRGWPIRRLGDGIAAVQIGPFGSLMHHDDYVEDGTPVINPMHIVDGRIVPDPRHAVGKAKLKALSRYLLHEGDVIIGRRGEMGRCAVVGPAEEGMVCGSGSAVIRLDASKVMAVYMGALLSSSRIKKLLEERALGVTMLNLNSQIISDLVIPVPPISQQQEFVQALEKVQDQKALALASVSQLASLFSSLQHRTLRGEL